jgi:excisionase family DNA binding protein
MTPPDDSPLPAGLVLLGLADLESLSRSFRSAAEPATADRTEEAGASATMSVDSAARYLGISRSHAYDLIRAGKIPHLKLGRRIIIPRRELDAMITRAVTKEA